MKLFIRGIPVAKQSMYTCYNKKANKTVYMKSKKVINEEQNIRAQAIQQLPKNHKLLTGPILIEKLVFIFPPLKKFEKMKKLKEAIESGKLILKSTTPDIDNSQKNFFDALQGVVWQNDSRIVGGLDWWKAYGAIPGVYIEFEEIEEYLVFDLGIDFGRVS